MVGVVGREVRRAGRFRIAAFNVAPGGREEGRTWPGGGAAFNVVPGVRTPGPPRLSTQNANLKATDDRSRGRGRRSRLADRAPAGGRFLAPARGLARPRRPL